MISVTLSIASVVWFYVKNLFKMFRILFLLTITLIVFSQGRDEEYCRKYSGNEDDFIDCCITLFPALDDEDKSEEVKYNICERNNDKCEEYNCMMETDDLLLPDGTIDKSAVITKAMADKEEVVWSKVIKQSYTKCAQVAESSNCPTMAFVMCFEATTFIECPRSEWNNTASCNEAKRFVQSCLLKA